MSREISGVTLETLPQAVRKIGLRPGQTFKITLEDEDEVLQAFERIQEISAAVTARAQADGVVTDEDVEKLLNS